MITSKLTSKSQTTVPMSVRKALNLKPGDLIEYEIRNEQAVLKKVEPERAEEDPFGTFTEWCGEEDEEAYAEL